MNLQGPGDVAEVGRVASQVRDVHGSQETQLTELTSFLFVQLFVWLLPLKSQTAAYPETGVSHSNSSTSFPYHPSPELQPGSNVCETDVLKSQRR